MTWPSSIVLRRSWHSLTAKLIFRIPNPREVNETAMTKKWNGMVSVARVNDRSSAEFIHGAAQSTNFMEEDSESPGSADTGEFRSDFY